MELLNSIILHPYVLAIYGVLLWQVEQFFSLKLPMNQFWSTAKGNIYRSMVWVGLVVVFDDELLAKYNHWAAMDYQAMPLYMYTIAGFFIDFIRSKIIDKVR